MGNGQKRWTLTTVARVQWRLKRPPCRFPGLVPGLPDPASGLTHGGTGEALPDRCRPRSYHDAVCAPTECCTSGCESITVTAQVPRFRRAINGHYCWRTRWRQINHCLRRPVSLRNLGRSPAISIVPKIETAEIDSHPGDYSPQSMADHRHSKLAVWKPVLSTANVRGLLTSLKSWLWSLAMVTLPSDKLLDGVLHPHRALCRYREDLDT